MYFLAMESAWPLTAMAKARRASSPSEEMRRKASRGNLESMAISFLSRRKMTASAASPLEKRYCVANCDGGRESSRRRWRVTSPRRPRVLAPPRMFSRDCVASERPRLCSCTSALCDCVCATERRSRRSSETWDSSVELFLWLCAIWKASQRMTMAKTTAAMSTAEFIDYYFTRTKKNSPPTWGAEKGKVLLRGREGWGG